MKKSFFQMKGFPIITKLQYDTNDFDFSTNKSLEVEIAVKTSSKNINETEANVILELEIFPKKENAPFYLKMTSQASFIWLENNNQIKSLLKTNAPAIILSYIRPLISNITTYSGQPPLIIPLLDFTNN